MRLQVSADDAESAIEVLDQPALPGSPNEELE
jgi:hypothetical protein